MVLAFTAALGRSLLQGSRSQPDSPAGGAFPGHSEYHRILAAFYDNIVYEDAGVWQAYKSRYRLPRTIRSVYNPVRRAVDWYAGHVYSGAWTLDGQPLPDGTPNALNFPSDEIATRSPLILAAIQALDWGNWRSARNVYVRDGAKLGSVFVEIVDDLDRNKVYPEVVPLDRVANLRLDATGNVKAYSIAYTGIDADTTQPFSYRKDVTPDVIREYRGAETVREERNPYGFAPAAWVKHRDVGGVLGAAAVDGVIPKIDEINRLATSIHNYIALLQKQPVVFYGKTSPGPLGGKATATSDSTASVNSDEAVPWMYSSDENGKHSMLMAPVPIEGAGAEVARILQEIEADLPELTMDRELRSMSQVTGPGADRMLGDVRGRLDEAQANYDAGTVKLMQMGVAIGGWRLGTGAWGPASRLTQQQQKFRPFGLDSYAAGQLDLTMLPRPLVPSTESERLASMQQRRDVAALSDAEVRRQLGYTPVEISRIDAELDAEAQRGVVGAF